MASAQRILILCKTYPSPSSKYVETSCVAGMTEGGQLVRLYPVPFRLIKDAQKFRKWQWIRARIRRSQDDARAESHRISVDTIELDGAPLPTAHSWFARRQAIECLPIFDSFDELEASRVAVGMTLGLVRPSRLEDLEVTPVAHDEWSTDELAKLLQAQQQATLFDADEERQALRTLKKLPFDFHYRYECQTTAGALTRHRHKLVDWEIGALYWNLRDRADWREALRDKFLEEFRDKDLLFLMGTIHRFPQQWLIISVLYAPRLPGDAQRQQSLF